ncbi:MAG: hypothetical protein ACFFFH_04110 [Candidatus Thorarchaeota archaeon]
MQRKNKSQWGRISVLLLLVIGSVTLHSLNLNLVDIQALNTYENESVLVESEIASNYNPDFIGNGKECNVTLQQSLIDISSISILNTSDPLNNTFYEPCPTTENFPSSFVNMTIEDIYAPNKTIIIEDEKHQNGFFDFTNVPETAASFQVKSSCYLQNVSVYLYHDDPGTENATVRFILYNSTWDSINNRSIPGANNNGYVKDLGTTQFDESFIWVNLTCSSEVILNNSKTENNTWFIGLIDINPQHARWAVTEDSGIAGDASDDSDCYNWLAFPPPGEWILAQSVLSRNIDFPLKVTVTPYISPPNQTLIIEDGPDNNHQQFDDVVPAASSFKISDNCFLENISVELYNPYSPENITVKLALFNSTWNSTEIVSKPGGLKYDYIQDLGIVNYSASLEWVTLSGLHIYLDNLKTENNTWFIGLFTISNSLHEGYWEWNWISQGNGIDDTRSYTYQTFPSTKWILAEAFGQKVDYHLKIDLKPPNNTPNPENINLRINTSIIEGDECQFGSGYWMSTIEYISSSGFLSFAISADWWDVSCTVTYVKIVYSKTDVSGNSSFTVGNEEDVVVWNVTEREGLNYFDPRINETTTINYTIPTNWYNINIFNRTINKTDDITIGSPNNGYKQIFVINAGSGDWFLTASSANILESIDSYKGLSPENVFNYSNIIHFNVSFKEMIAQNEGLINLSIYSPALINDLLNFTLVKTTFDTGQEISLGEWDVSDTVTQYGIFRVQASWNNATAVGFMEDTLTIIGESNLLLIEPPQNAIFDPDQQFTIIVYYEDVHLHRAIADAVIKYNIAEQGLETTTIDNGTAGFYLIPVDCRELSSSGSKRVEITATQEFYSIPTLEYMFEISESTSTTITTSTIITTQPRATTSPTTTTTTTTTTFTETGTFPGVVTVFTILGTLVMFIRRRAKM